MLKNVSQLEVKINGKDYRLTCDMDSPLSDAKEALFQFGRHIGQIEDQVKAALAAKEEKKEESLKEVENGVKLENECSPSNSDCDSQREHRR